MVSAGTMDDLIAIFAGLPVPDSVADAGETFASHSVGSDGRWRLAKSITGLPAVLVAFEVDAGVERPLAVSLENLRVGHNVLCSVRRSEGGTEVGRYSIIECLTDDGDVQKCFLRAIGGALMGMQGSVRPGDISDLIHQLVALLRLMKQPGQRQFRGLWGELFVILRGADAATMIDAWHREGYERFDFSHGRERLEVKSSSSRLRDHIFSLEQVCPPSGVSVLVASVQVEEQTNGATLGELWDEVADAAPTGDARLRVERTCVEALGEDLAAGRAFSADWNLAMDSISFYSVADIPRPPCECPPGVSGVRFRSDLSAAKTIGASGLGSFHKCCLGAILEL